MDQQKKGLSLFRRAPTHLELIGSIVPSAKPCKRHDQMSSRCFLHIRSVLRDGEKAPFHFFFPREKRPFSVCVCEYSSLNNADVRLVDFVQVIPAFHLFRKCLWRNVHVPGVIKRVLFCWNEVSGFMTGLKVEYSCSHSCNLLRVLPKGIYMERCILTGSCCVHKRSERPVSGTFKKR